MRTQFVSVGETPGTKGPVVGVWLPGNGWTQAEREAAEQEDAELSRRYPDRYLHRAISRSVVNES